METNQMNSPNAFQHKRQGQGTYFKNQQKTIFHYLQQHAATAAMVSRATGIPHKNICRYKRDLEQSGKLWEVKKDLCKETGNRAWYLSTNPNLAPKGI